jgi:uncharacterized protein with HEPN domain
MSSRNWPLRISDILEAIAKVSRYTAGMDPDSFAADDKTVDAVLRNLELIGEAARNLPDDFVAGHPHIPWHEMRGMRNILIHEYFGVSLPIVWHTVTQDLPALVPLLNEILDQE